jgi:dienelactone hydrolase
MHLFGAVQHAFTNVGIERLGLAGFHYDARATRRSWAMMLDMLDEVLACGPILQPEHSLP